MIMMIPFGMVEVKAADSYEDAVDFYENAKNIYHCEFADMNFYYATKGKIGNPDKIRYGSIGWRITATANGKTLFIDVDKDPENPDKKTQMIHIDNQNYNGYSYDLYSISYEAIANLMSNKDSATWNKINESSWVTFSFTAIMSIKPGGETDTVSHVIAEDGKGGVTFDNTTHVYYLGTDEGLAGIQALFTSTDFSPFYKIKQRVENPTLTITYNLNGGKINSTGTALGYSAKNDVLCKNGSEFTQTGKRQGFVYPLTQSAIGLEKTGYKLVSGKEWINDSKYAYNEYVYLTAGAKYFSSNLHQGVATSNQTITLTANWTPITYKLVYHANDGSGNTTTKSCTYGNTYSVLSNMYTYANHTFKGWNTKSDGSGDWYTEGQSVSDLRSVDGETFDLYAIWNPNVYEITIDANGGTGGTGKFYEIFGSIHIFFCRRPNSNYFLEEKYP